MTRKKRISKEDIQVWKRLSEETVADSNATMREEWLANAVLALIDGGSYQCSATQRAVTSSPRTRLRKT